MNAAPSVAYTAAIAERFAAGRLYKSESQKGQMHKNIVSISHPFDDNTGNKTVSLWDLCVDSNFMYLVITNDVDKDSEDDVEKADPDDEKPVPNYPVSNMTELKRLVKDRRIKCCYLTPFTNTAGAHEYEAKIELMEICKHFFVRTVNRPLRDNDTEEIDKQITTAFRRNGKIYLPLFVYDNVETLDGLFRLKTQFAIPSALRKTVVGNTIFKADEFEKDLEAIYPSTGLKIKAGTSFYHTGSSVSGAKQVSHTTLGGRTMAFDNDTEKDKMDLFFQWHPVFISSNLTTVAPCRPSSLDGTAVAEYVTEDIDISEKTVCHIVCHNNNPINKTFITELHELIEKINQDDVLANKLILLIWSELPRIDQETTLPVFDVIDNESKVSMITFHNTYMAGISDIHKRLFMCAEGKATPPFRIVKNIASLMEHSPVKLTN